MKLEAEAARERRGARRERCEGGRREKGTGEGAMSERGRVQAICKREAGALCDAVSW